MDGRGGLPVLVPRPLRSERAEGPSVQRLFLGKLAFRAKPDLDEALVLPHVAYMHISHSNVAWPLLTVCCMACTTVMYNGARRPSNSVARVSASDGPDRKYCRTDIVKVDGRDVGGGTYEILPGRHSVKITSKSLGTMPSVIVSPMPIVGPALLLPHEPRKRPVAYDPTTVCFDAQAGREYSVRTLSENGIWEIEVVDEETDENIKIPCD